MKNKALKIGITGGIGSGKTTVCHIFETLGIPVYYADDRAKALMVEDETLIKGIKHLFGEAAYFDPESNSFVMPYAEPVQRRAMTPPPGGAMTLELGLSVMKLPTFCPPGR